MSLCLWIVLASCKLCCAVHWTGRTCHTMFPPLTAVLFELECRVSQIEVVLLAMASTDKHFGTVAAYVGDCWSAP